MKLFAVAAAAAYLTFATAAWAQSTMPADPPADTDSKNRAVVESAPAKTEATESGMMAEVKQLKAQVQALIADARVAATDVVREAPGATALSHEQVAGIAVGIVAGAVVADILGAGGLATLSLSAGGGVLGHWLASEL